EFTTAETIGESCDRMAAHFGISRDEQAEYGLRSQKQAAQATHDGLLDEQLLPTTVPPDFDSILYDNGFREDTSMGKLGKLDPAFIKHHGTVTVGYTSFLMYWASAALIIE